MEFPLTLLDLAGAVALLLWGVRMVQTGVQRAFGAALRGFLARALRTRLRAFLAGAVVTALLQSSTATGLMVAGFVANGLVELVPALAVMLGANVGSTLIVQLLSFDVSAIAPALILIGVVLFRRASASPRDFGRVLIGLGLILTALHQFIDLLTPYEDVPSLRVLLGQVSTEPVLDVILAAGLTWAAHSSVAVVLLIMSFAAKGAVPPHAAFALVLGANLGTAVNPLLEGSEAGDPASRRLPVGNLAVRALGVVLALATLPWAGPLLVTFEPDTARAVADFHTAFNLILAAVLLPLLGPFAALLRRVLPARVDEADPGRPLYLDPLARDTPVVAIGAAAREALRLADLLESMLGALRDTLDRGDRRRLMEIRRLDDFLDRLNREIKSYLTSLDPESLSDADHQRMWDILAFVTNMEQAGDVVVRNLGSAASRRLKRGLAFPPEERAALLGIVDRLTANLRTAAAVFMTGDLRAARLLAGEKEHFRVVEADASAMHFRRLREGRVDVAEISTLHLDMLRDLVWVNAHIVAAASYPVLERSGELLPSRLREDG